MGYYYRLFEFYTTSEMEIIQMPQERQDKTKKKIFVIIGEPRADTQQN